MKTLVYPLIYLWFGISPTCVPGKWIDRCGVFVPEHWSVTGGGVGKEQQEGHQHVTSLVS